jgi:GAF domain-containing protein
MGRDTKTVGKPAKKRRPTEARIKSRRAPKPKRADEPSVVNRKSGVAALTRELREAMERQTATAGILQIIASSPSDVQPVFEAIVRSANTLIGGFSSTVFRFIDGVGYLKAFTPTTPAADEVLQATFPLPITDFLPFQMAQAGEATQFADTETLSNEILNIARARGFRSIMFAPMMSDGVSIGSIAVTRAQPGTFADHHVQLLQTFADQAVIAIENVRLFEQVQAKTRDLSESLQQQTATADVLKVISRSAFDRNMVTTAILQAAAQLCRASLATLHLRDGDVCRLATQFGLPEAFEQVSRDNPIPARYPLHSRRQARAGEFAQFTDAWSDSDYLYKAVAKLGGYRAIIVIPMMREDELVGIFSLARPEPEPFTPGQIKLVQTFADQAAIAIENARLFNETKEALERQTATADILRVIANSPTNVQPVFEAIAERSKRLVDALSTTVFRLENGVMHLEAFTPTNPEADATLKVMFPAPLSNFSWSEAIGNGEIYRVVDTELEIERLRALARLRGFRSMLLVPLLRDRKPIGVISVTRVEPGSFVEHPDLRRPSRDRDRECAPVRRSAGKDPRPHGGTTATDRDRRRSESHQPLGIRSEIGSHHVDRVGAVAVRRDARNHMSARRRGDAATGRIRLHPGLYRFHGGQSDQAWPRDDHRPCLYGRQACPCRGCTTRPRV